MSSHQSQKEREILERQKRLASSLKRPPPPPSDGRGPPNAIKSRNSASRKPPPPPPPKQSKSSFSVSNFAAGKSAVVDLTETPAATSNKPPRSAAAIIPPTKPAQKRPTRKRTLPQSKDALLKDARLKASSNGTTISVPVAASLEKDAKPSPPIQRKVRVPSQQSSSSLTGGGSLAKLVQYVGKDVTSDAMDTIPTIKPDDFWKHLREWDFCSQYASLQLQTDNTNKTETTVKSIPNTFLNARHYMAAWSPHCLAECRAQLLQEFITNSNKRPIAITTESTNSRKRLQRGEDLQVWMEEETGGHVLLRPKHDASGMSRSELSFMSNDIVYLVRNEYASILEDIEKGTARAPSEEPNAYRSVGLIGHTETSRQDWTKGGLVVKVSKRKWAKYGQDDMYMVRLGSNVTALREFTALCRVDTLPMQRYLFCAHLEREEHRRKLSSRQSTENLLQILGGKEALGKGFIAHCKNKFNNSQLTAIAASANEYGQGGFTLIKGPPGTGKTTTLVAVLNSLHIRQFNKYYDEVRRIAAQRTGSRHAALELARKAKPRLLVCAPSNAAVDNIILKIMEDGFIDGQGLRYNPSMIRVGVGQGDAVRAVALSTKVDSILADADIEKLLASIAGYRSELSRITAEITKLRRRLHGIQEASPYPLSKHWEIRVDEETFDTTGRVYFVNHQDKTTTYEVPPPPEPGDTHFPATSMPEYRNYLSRIVKNVESYFSIKSHLERCTIIQSGIDRGSNNTEIRMGLETHILNSVHMVMTTLGTAGNRTLDNADRFEVVVCDEAAQSVEPASLSALQLGKRHAVLVGDPQQLPATIFNVSGRNSKYDRSLFQRLEEAGQPVYMLNEQYRMHPKISHFPRHIFYRGALLDGPNVKQADYGNPLRGVLTRMVPNFQPLTILDLDSKEERGGTSLSNIFEARLAVYLYQQLKVLTRGLSGASRVAIITPYAQQSKLLRRLFNEALGPRVEDMVEVNTVDAFQGREANIVIFSAVRAAGSNGIGFLSDVRRMNVALTRAKHFLFVIARCESIVVNPYWRDLVEHARESNAVVTVPSHSFGSLTSWPLEEKGVVK